MYADDARCKTVKWPLYRKVRFAWIMWRIGAMTPKTAIRTFLFN
jgi:hypothetical protein